MDILHILKSDDQYPAALPEFSRNDAPDKLTAIGNAQILTGPILALLCSRRCPGSIILDTYDLMQVLSRERITVVSGFHSPVEKECLNTLLRAKSSAIVCPARSIERMRMPSAYKKALEDGRMLVLSPFEEKQKRPTTATSLYRNRLVAALADSVFVAHASSESKTEAFARELIGLGKRVLTFRDEHNSRLHEFGAIAVKPHDVAAFNPAVKA